MAEKSSSASRKASHKRARDNAEIRREKRIARHARRCKTTPKALSAASGLSLSPHFPRLGTPRPRESVVFSGQVPKQSGQPLHIVVSNGVTLEISPWLKDATDAKGKIQPGIAFFHGVINPISGKISHVDSRGFQ